MLKEKSKRLLMEAVQILLDKCNCGIVECDCENSEECELCEYCLARALIVDAIALERT